MRVVLRDLYYPGWRGTIGETEVELRFLPGRGNIQLTVPPGRHDVRVWLDATGFRKASRWVSVVAALLLAAALVGERLGLSFGLRQTRP